MEDRVVVKKRGRPNRGGGRLNRGSSKNSRGRGSRQGRNDERQQPERGRVDRQQPEMGRVERQQPERGRIESDDRYRYKYCMYHTRPNTNGCCNFEF